jgi:hypothetical protein
MRKLVILLLYAVAIFNNSNATSASDTNYILVTHGGSLDRLPTSLYLCVGNCESQADTIVSSFDYRYITISDTEYLKIIQLLSCLDTVSKENDLKHPLFIYYRKGGKSKLIRLKSLAKTDEFFDEILIKCITDQKKRYAIQFSQVEILARIY